MFWDVIFPVFTIITLGYLFQKITKLNLTSISTLALHIMAPALTFTTFYEAEIDITYFYIFLHGLVLVLLLMYLSKLYAVIFNLSPKEYASFQLSTMFMNTGNYGLPIILFAFGGKALEYGIAIMLIQTLFMSTMGLFIAARGNYSINDSLKRVLKMPMVYAVVLSLLFNYCDIFNVPDNIFNAFDLVSQAAIPTMILILGMQLARVSLLNLKWSSIVSALAIRLVVSPLIALIIVLFMPITNLLASVLIVQAAMPSATIITMYALEYRCQPEYVSSVALLSTLLSAGTITIILLMM